MAKKILPEDRLLIIKCELCGLGTPAVYVNQGWLLKFHTGKERIVCRGSWTTVGERHRMVAETGRNDG